MSLRILGGFARGFSLLSPPVISTRPTSVMLRRRLFDAYQDLSEFQFIDLFSGTGAVGLEACSRGAQKIILNEINRASFSICRKNVEKFNQSYSSQNFKILLNQVDALAWLKKSALNFLESGLESIIYIDPPYEQHQLYFDTLKLLKEMNYSGDLWIESDKLKGVREENLREKLSSVKKQFIQGDHFVLIGKV